MKEFKSTTLIKKAFSSKETKKALPYVMFLGMFWQKYLGKYSTVQALVSGSPTLSEEGMIKGFKRVSEISESKIQFVYNVYSEEQINEDKTRKDAVIMHFPSNSEERKPFVLICAGREYSMVNSGAEAFSTAKAFNDLGYTAFVVNYRVFERPLMPLPIEDLVMAVRFVNEHADEFNVLKDNYIVNGFSAGGNLVNLFCSKKVGYANYGLAKPLMNIAVYSGCDIVTEDEEDKKFKYTTKLLGYSRLELVNDYLVSKNAETFPKTFIVFAEDDDFVKPKEHQKLVDTLNELKIENKVLIGYRGRHGFGSGEGTPLEGWVDKAIEYLLEK
ncbi:MAG: alpha/beta hydrolase [Bacilli bacterium]|nr:alpha/beta hydrolase [Bacilli bacterium]